MDDKFVILVGDGMGDYPIDRLGGLTPLEAAPTPNLDRLAGIGQMGTVQTVPKGMDPGSDVANMSLLGYDPAVYHTGRGPLEAASMGVQLHPDDVAFRCNIVFLDEDSSGRVLMGDYSAGHISTPEAKQLVSALQSAVSETPLKLYPGVSYRHLLVWRGGPDRLRMTPPHDITGQAIAPYDAVPSEPVLHSFATAAAKILKDHPVNIRRKSEGKRPGNAVWLWGQGKAPAMPKLRDRFGVEGAMISAVDLLKGIGVYAGLEAIDVPGATGYLDTNYDGKVAAALSALEKGNFVFLHLEAPDEASHEGSLEKKLEAIQKFDERIVGPMLEGIRKYPSVNVLVAPDHYTPISKRTHSCDPVPFLMAKLVSGSTVADTGRKYCEREAVAAGRQLGSGAELFRAFMEM